MKVWGEFGTATEKLICLISKRLWQTVAWLRKMRRTTEPERAYGGTAEGTHWRTPEAGWHFLCEGDGVGGQTSLSISQTKVTKVIMKLLSDKLSGMHDQWKGFHCTVTVCSVEVRRESGTSKSESSLSPCYSMVQRWIVPGMKCCTRPSGWGGNWALRQSSWFSFSQPTCSNLGQYSTAHLRGPHLSYHNDYPLYPGEGR